MHRNVNIALHLHEEQSVCKVQFMVYSESRTECVSSVCGVCCIAIEQPYPMHSEASCGCAQIMHPTAQIDGPRKVLTAGAIP
jgi:hypothetical protein